MRRAARIVAPLIVAPLMLTACMGGLPRRGPDGPGGPQGGGAPLFISPFGEPFMSPPGAPWPSAEWFAGADHDGNGALTFVEFQADGQRWFAHLDRNGDGRLNPAELTEYETGLAGLRGAGRMGFPGGGQARPDGPPRRLDAAEPPQSRRSGRRPGSSGRRGPGGERGYGRVADAGWFNLPQPVKAADIDVDQTVTTEEWTQATQRWFAALDIDHDGRLTLAALPRTPLQAQAEAGRR